MDIARLALDVDTRKLKAGERDLKGFGDTANRTAMQVDKGAIGMSAAFSQLGKAVAQIGVTTALFQFGKASAQAAIDAEEMASAFDVVFGSMSADVEAWAETTGNALGRSTQEIMRGALAFQELFGKALDPAQAAELSKQFAVLTQDLASFKNLSNEVAQQKLFSGLVGEAEPLRSVGVFLNEAAVQAKAAELGLQGVNGVLTDQEKIVARAALIQEQLAQASGDVERTSDSAANQIKTYQAAVEELQVAIGQKLLPSLTPLISASADVVNITVKLVEGFGTLANDARNLASVFDARLSPNISEADARLRGLVRTAASAQGPIGQLVGWFASLGMGGASRPTVSPLGITVDAMLGLARQARATAVATGGLADPTSNATVAVTGLGNAAEKAGRQSDTAADDFQRLYERLFPFEAAMRQLEADENLIRSNKQLTEARKEELLAALEQDRFRSRTGRLGDATVSRGLLNTGPLNAGNDNDLGKTVERMRAEAEATRLVAEGDFKGAMEVLRVASRTTTVTVAENFAQMSQKVTASLQGLANSIRGGDFLGILGGVLNIFTSLGSAGVFGGGVQNFLSRSSFDGGGYTGSGSRSGGLDGKGGFLAMLHPNETVIDHHRGQRMSANDTTVRVTVGIDPNSGNVTAFVNNQIAATAPAIANAGAALAQGQMAQRARRRVR